jgi:hypothetical protein
LVYIRVFVGATGYFALSGLGASLLFAQDWSPALLIAALQACETSITLLPWESSHYILWNVILSGGRGWRVRTKDLVEATCALITPCKKILLTWSRSFAFDCEHLSAVVLAQDDGTVWGSLHYILWNLILKFMLVLKLHRPERPWSIAQDFSPALKTKWWIEPWPGVIIVIKSINSWVCCNFIQR